MSEEITKTETQVIRVGDGMGDMDFSSDEEMAVFLERVERRNEAIERVLKMALQKLIPTDFHDFDGKPLLQGTGAQRLIKYFGISVTNKRRNPEVGYRVDPNDPAKRLSVAYSATFRLGTMEVEGEGRRDTHNKLLCRKDKEFKNIADINLPDLDASAVTAMYRDGVSTLLGLKGMSWGYLKELGFSPDKTTGHKYQTGTSGGDMAGKNKETKNLKTEIVNMIFEMSGQDPEKAKDMLESYTVWKNDDGTIKRAGIRDSGRLTEKQTPVIYGKVEKDYKDFAPAKPEPQAEDDLFPSDYLKSQKE